jgi:hypothetical protein
MGSYYYNATDISDGKWPVKADRYCSGNGPKIRVLQLQLDWALQGFKDSTPGKKQMQGKIY